MTENIGLRSGRDFSQDHERFALLVQTHDKLLQPLDSLSISKPSCIQDCALPIVEFSCFAIPFAFHNEPAVLWLMFKDHKVLRQDNSLVFFRQFFGGDHNASGQLLCHASYTCVFSVWRSKMCSSKYSSCKGRPALAQPIPEHSLQPPLPPHHLLFSISVLHACICSARGRDRGQRCRWLLN